MPSMLDCYSLYPDRALIICLVSMTRGNDGTMVDNGTQGKRNGAWRIGNRCEKKSRGAYGNIDIPAAHGANLVVTGRAPVTLDAL